MCCRKLEASNNNIIFKFFCLISKIIEIHIIFYLFISDQIVCTQENMTTTQCILNEDIDAVYKDNSSQQVCVPSTLNSNSTEPCLTILNKNEDDHQTNFPG